jgi:hypothetical protein
MQLSTMSGTSAAVFTLEATGRCSAVHIEGVAGLALAFMLSFSR